MHAIVLDTNILIQGNLEWIKENADKYQFIVPLVVLEELDKLKSDVSIGNDVRKAINWIDANLAFLKFDISYAGNDEYVDNILIKICENNDYMLATYDKLLQVKAKIAGISLFDVPQIKQDDYKGFKIVEMDDEELSSWYMSECKPNKWDLLINEYLIIKNHGEVVDIYKWTNNGFVRVLNKKLESTYFGKVKALDEFQTCFIDSMLHNQLTMVTGKAGSGKSYLTVAFAMNQIEKGKYSKLIIFSNPINTLNSAKLGFYPGTKDEKLLDSSCGNILLGKFNDRTFIEQKIREGIIMLLPFSDIRGFDTSGMNAIIWIQEAQNLDINLMKIALQRVGNDCKCIIDGDFETQVDKPVFELYNGMQRVSEVFRGTEIYGQIELQNVYRSDIAKIADKM